MQAAESVSTTVAKAAPPIVVTSAQSIGITVPEAIQDLTLIYIGLMVIHKVWHMWKEWRTGKVTPESEGELP